MPPPAPTKRELRQNRRLVPDIGDTIAARGQKLTRVVREAATAADRESAPDPELGAESEDMLDVIARRHLGASVEDLIDSLASEPPAAPDEPSLLAGRLELFSDRGDIPNAETNPKKREEGAVSPIILTDDAPDFLSGRAKPETLLDLFSLFPMLDGVNWFIHVNRKEPKLYAGMTVRGVQRPVTRVMSYAEWQAVYGGTVFELIVYGPPKNGLAMDSSGRVSPKKLTEPITIHFPGPPSLEGMVFSEGDPDPMNLAAESQLPRRPATIGEAKVEETRLEIGAKREIRQESREEEERKEKEKLLRDQATSAERMMAQFMTLQQDAAKREGDLREKMFDREREHTRQLQDFTEQMEEKFKELLGSAKPDDVERFIKMNTSLNQHNKGGDTDALREEHARELGRLTEQRTKDSEAFARQLKDERERSDRICADERARADQRIKDAEERYHNKERDERERASSEVQKVKDECERRLQDMHRQHTDRIADLDRNHARDIAGKESAHVMQLDTLKSTHEMRLDAARGDVKRAGVDIERYKREAEEGRDVVGRITKLKEEASALGMVEASESGDSEPETVPQMLMKIGANVAGALPQIVENIAGMMKGRNEQETQQALALQRQAMINQAGSAAQGTPFPAAHNRRGATPRLAPLQPIAQVGAAPLIPGHEPHRHVSPPGTIRPIPAQDQQPEEIMRQQFLASQAEQQAHDQAQTAQAFLAQQAVYQEPVVPGSGVDPLHTGMPPEPQMGQAPAAPTIPPPGFAVASPPAVTGSPTVSAETVAEDRSIVSTEGHLLPSYTNNISPAIVAAEFLNRFPKEAIRQLLSELGTPDRISEAYERERGPSHPFTRRDGKKFLREIFALLEKGSR